MEISNETAAQVYKALLAQNVKASKFQYGLENADGVAGALMNLDQTIDQLKQNHPPFDITPLHFLTPSHPDIPISPLNEIIDAFGTDTPEGRRLRDIGIKQEHVEFLRRGRETYHQTG